MRVSLFTLSPLSSWPSRFQTIPMINLPQLICTLALVDFIKGHSWPDNIAGGMCRGCNPGLSDLVRQRYYCPFNSLSQCTPPANSGVVLTAENLRPCRTSPSLSSPMGNAVAGQQMYVHWAGNGHTSPTQSGSTCVSVSIAPYAVDPDRSAFTTLASCLPFTRPGELTDGYVTLPANLASGRYTVFWLWDFAGFWFSGCTDINVSSSGGATTTSTSPTTTRPQSTTRTTSQPTTTRPSSSTASTARPATTTTARPTGGSASGAIANDCKKYTLPNSQCKTLYGPNSFCASWASDKCGYSHCQGERYSDSTCPPRLL